MANPPYRPITVEQLRTLPPTEWLAGSHFVARGLNVVFGPSESFKSFYVLGASLGIAQSLPVVFVAGEGAGGLFQRIEAWCDYYKLLPGDIHFICEPANLFSTEATESLIAALKPIRPALVVFDTLARCASGADENSARDMGRVVANTGLLQRKLNTAAAWIHHTNRADTGERGSGAIRGAADSMIEVSAGGDGQIRVECSKSKDEKKWEPEIYTFHPVGRSGLLIPPSESLTVSLKLTETEKKIMEFLGLSVFESAGAQFQQVVKALNVSERHVYRLLSGLKNKGLARNVSTGLPMNLTDMGLEVLRTFSDKSLPIAEVLGKVEVD